LTPAPSLVGWPATSRSTRRAWVTGTVVPGARVVSMAGMVARRAGPIGATDLNGAFETGALQR
jgi:hypothetical protein